jgi:acyl-CoA synthetase (AMP-forming)/AMP-acid ligase II
MRPKARAYSHRGHGPRADQQAGYISATSAACAELTCDQQPVHTFGSQAAAPSLRINVCSSANSGRAIMFVEALPRTANGKIMRQALRLPAGFSTG